MASLGQKQTSTNLANAERIRKAVNARVNSSAAGWVTPVVVSSVLRTRRQQADRHSTRTRCYGSNRQASHLKHKLLFCYCKQRGGIGTPKSNSLAPHALRLSLNHLVANGSEGYERELSSQGVQKLSVTVGY